MKSETVNGGTIYEWDFDWQEHLEFTPSDDLRTNEKGNPYEKRMGQNLIADETTVVRGAFCIYIMTEAWRTELGRAQWIMWWPDSLSRLDMHWPIN